MANRTIPIDIHSAIVTRALHAAHSSVVLTDPRQDDNPIIWVNDHFCRLTGYSRKEILGRNCRLLQEPEREQPERAELREHITRGEPIDVLIRNYRKDGTLFYNELYVSPVYEEGELVYFIGVQNDVTAREEARRLKAERERERALLEATERERERLGMDLHDGLGQVLAGVRMLAEVLRGDLAQDAPRHEAAAQHLGDLLAEAQEEARRIAHGLNPIVDSPSGLYEALRALTQHMSTSSEATIKIEAPIDPILFQDPRQSRHLYRIAQEAVSNALRHAQPRSISLSLRREAELICLDVTDDGTGLPAALAHHINRDDAQHAGAEALSALGMGLFSMRFRAQQIGARLQILTPPEGGTTVRVTLPYLGRVSPRASGPGPSPAAAA